MVRWSGVHASPLGFENRHPPRLADRGLSADRARASSRRSARGRLAPGSALPGSRELAESLEVNRKTVIQAYAELDAQGWLATEQTRGTFVSVATAERRAGKRGRRDAARRAERSPDRTDFRLVGSPRRTSRLILPRTRICWSSMMARRIRGRFRSTRWRAPIARR